MCFVFTLGSDPFRQIVIVVVVGPFLLLLLLLP